MTTSTFIDRYPAPPDSRMTTTYQRPDEKHPASAVDQVCDEQDRWWIIYRFNGRLFRCRLETWRRDCVLGGVEIKEQKRA